MRRPRRAEYEFIPLAEKVKREGIESMAHEKFRGHTGEAEFEIEVISPLHVGSGYFELSEDARLNSGRVVRGIVKRENNPIIPGTSIKGMVRSIYEAITSSCLRCIKKDANEAKSKIPRWLIQQMTQSGAPNKEYVKVELKEVDRFKGCEYKEGAKLCPACSLFGAMGYKGRISFSDAILKESKKKQMVEVPALQSPHLHMVGTPSVEGSKIVVSKLKGRKFYRQSSRRRGNEPVDYIPEKSKLSFKMHFENLEEKELGGIFLCLGLDNSFIPRLGGGKTIGLGKIKVSLSKLEVWDTEKLFLSYKPDAAKPAPSVNDAIESFKRWHYFDGKAWDRLLQIFKS